eukprot:12899694-Prorocentrum_lima.AAC.1
MSSTNLSAMGKMVAALQSWIDGSGKEAFASSSTHTARPRVPPGSRAIRWMRPFRHPLGPGAAPGRS